MDGLLENKKRLIVTSPQYNAMQHRNPVSTRVSERGTGRLGLGLVATQFYLYLYLYTIKIQNN